MCDVMHLLQDIRFFITYYLWLELSLVSMEFWFFVFEGYEILFSLFWDSKAHKKNMPYV
jgi:hypothetical protein